MQCHAGPYTPSNSFFSVQARILGECFSELSCVFRAQLTAWICIKGGISTATMRAVALAKNSFSSIFESQKDFLLPTLTMEDIDVLFDSSSSSMTSFSSGDSFLDLLVFSFFALSAVFLDLFKKNELVVLERELDLVKNWVWV